MAFSGTPQCRAHVEPRMPSGIELVVQDVRSEVEGHQALEAAGAGRGQCGPPSVEAHARRSSASTCSG